MKRALPLVLLITGTVTILFGVLAVGAMIGWARAGHTPWPADLGRLEDLPSQFPKREPSASALRLAQLARPLGVDFAQKKTKADAGEGVANFVNGEQVRDVLVIGEPPAAVAEYIATHARAIDTVRDHLIRSNDIAWTVDLDKKFEAPLPNLLAHQHVVRLLVARALIRARTGDAGAWEDLHAASMLDRSLQRRPELLSQLISLHFARMINAAAWKLPLPAPGWLSELHAIDRRRLMLRGLQYDTWLLWRHGPEEVGGAWKFLTRPYLRVSVGNMAVHQRATAIELANVKACGFEGDEYFERRLKELSRWNIVGRIAVPNIGTVWSRVLRHEVEREATANALRARTGEPVSAESRCSDGSWRYDDGRISFTRAIPGIGKTDMPLALSLR